MTPISSIAPASSSNSIVAIQHQLALAQAAIAPIPVPIDFGPATVINLSNNARLFLGAGPFGVGVNDNNNTFAVAKSIETAQLLESFAGVGTRLNITV